MLNRNEFNNLELIPGEKLKPAFESREAQDKFFNNLIGACEPEFKRYKEAHRLSEQAAMFNVVY
ncbi:MAG: hypothetical protein Q8L27_01110 [archaeon]|nr:hypothetical protein [archaeon]